MERTFALIIKEAENGFVVIVEDYSIGQRPQGEEGRAEYKVFQNKQRMRAFVRKRVNKFTEQFEFFNRDQYLEA